MQISAHSRWRSMRTFEAAVIFHQFRKRYRGKTVDIRPGVQRLVHLRQQRPIDAVGVVVDMAINQVTAVGHMVPGHHGIVAQDQAVRAVAALQQGLCAPQGPFSSKPGRGCPRSGAFCPAAAAGRIPGPCNRTSDPPRCTPYRPRAHAGANSPAGRRPFPLRWQTGARSGG